MAHVTPFTVRAVLRTEKANSEDKCPISICITVAGKRAYHSTGLRVTSKQWKDGRVCNHTNAAHYNASIAKRLNEAEAELLKAEATDIKAAKQAVVGDSGRGSFIEYAERALPDMKMAPNTRRRWGIDLNHIRAYAPNLTWAEITPAWLTAFNKHLLSLRYDPKPGEMEGKLRLQQNSARKTFVFMRRVFNEAKKNHVTTLYPFKEWTLPAERETVKLYLTLEETDQIRSTLDEYPDMPKPMRSTIAHFLLECYAGIRHSDWGKWKVERLTGGESLYLSTTKTNEPIYLPLKDSPRLYEIINYIRDNNLPYTYSNQDANRVLKNVAIMAKVKKRLTTHTARHTCATLLLQKGLSRETVAEVLGVSMRVIDTYAKVTRQKVRREYEEHGGL